MLLRANLMLLLTAFIWGFGFVAQDEAMKHLDAYSFNALRFLLGALSLLPLVCFSGTTKASSFNGGKPFWVIGGLAGIALLFGATLQQLGIDVLGNDPNEATEGKAGFITGLYLVIVPLIGFCLRQKIDKLTIVGTLVATYGLYLLSIKEGLTIGEGDSLVLIGAFFWAVHVQVVGYAAKYKLDPLKLAILQYSICAALSLGLYFLNYHVLEIGVDKLSLQSTLDASGAILFAGFVSVGVAYTLQIIAQRHVAPSRAAILLSLEAVFAVLAGWLWDGNLLDSRESWGCMLMFAGMMLSQAPTKKPKDKDTTSSTGGDPSA